MRFLLHVRHLRGTPGGEEGVERRWRELASAQHSVITRRELLDAGLSPRQIGQRVQAGQLHRYRKGIYTVAGAPATWEQRALCVVRWAGKGAALAGPSAAALWSFDGFAKGELHVITPNGASHPDVKLRRCRLDPADVRIRSAIRVTCIERTLLDLAATAPRRVEGALDHVLHRRLTVIPRLRHYLEARSRRGVTGGKILKELVDIRDPALAPVESLLETRLAAILRRTKIPPPVTQHVVVDDDRFVARLDFAYPLLRFGIEADGFEFHSGRLRWKKDLRRHNQLTNLGWRILHFTWHDVTRDAGYVERTIRAAL